MLRIYETIVYFLVNYGYTVEMYPGQNWGYAPKLYSVSLVRDYVSNGTDVYYAADLQNGSTEIKKTDGTVLATIATADGKTTITLSTDLFELYEEYMASTNGAATVRVTYIRDADGTGYTLTQTFTVL